MNVTISQLSKVNVGLAQFLAKEIEETKTKGESKESTSKNYIIIGNSVKAVSSDVDGEDQKMTNSYLWKMYVKSLPNQLGNLRKISKVVYYLHPTFSNPVVEVNNDNGENEDFNIECTGWGSFEIKVDLCFTDGEVSSFIHQLCLKCNTPPSETKYDITKTSNIRRTGKKSAMKPAIKSAIKNKAHRMENVDEASMHGRMGIGKNWLAPLLAHSCNKIARPGYNSGKAHEYSEEPSVLREKVQLLAQLLRNSEHCVTYTGAGISTASGIDDYASKGTSSFATGANSTKYRPKGRKGLDAEPTFAHYTLTELYNQGIVKHWVQQNHDGLPQKAGYPQHALNEIHGAWFDPSNPVVPMSGSLRDDLYTWMEEEEEKADLVLTMGTSLCGMNADRMVSTASEKYCQMGVGLGSVIIGFQRTQLDSICSLRIFARIDEVMLLLAREMKLNVSTTPYKFNGTSTHVYTMPYDKNGHLKATNKKKIKMMKLNLQRDSKIKLTSGPGKGYIGRVVRTPTMNNGYSFSVSFPCTREGHKDQGKKKCLYSLGGWMIDAACRGELDTIPIVNC